MSGAEARNRLAMGVTDDIIEVIRAKPDCGAAIAYNQQLCQTGATVAC